MAFKKIRLYGVLRQFGKEFDLDVNSPRDAVQALCSLVPGFENFLRNAESKGLVFSIFKGKRNLREEEFDMQSDNYEVIRIAPIIVGSKQAGIFQVVLGVALIVIGGIISGWTFGAGAPIGTALAVAGAGMAFGGIVQMLSPMPNMGSISERDGNKPGSGFGSAVTTTAQGHPVPLLYGCRDIGGSILSAGIYTEDAT